LNNMDLNNMDLKSSLLERLLNSNDIEKMIELLKLISNQESRANLDINTNINTNLDPNINTNANMNTNTNMNKNTNINSAPSDQHTYPDSIHRSGSLSTMGTPRDEKSISGEYIYIYINEWSVYVYIYIYIYIYLILNVLYIYIYVYVMRSLSTMGTLRDVYHVNIHICIYARMYMYICIHLS
jgi:hypothetical protein